MARSGGLFGWIGNALSSAAESITNVFTGSREPELAPSSPDTGYYDGGGEAGTSDVTDDTFVTESDDPPGQGQFDFDFQLSGFLELGADYKDDYVNLEGETVYLQFLPWADMDYFVIQVNEPGRDSYYVTISGDFDDYDDLLSAIAEWWEQGS